MTRNLKIFTAFCIIWSVLFFSVLVWALDEQESRWPYIAVASLTYGIGFSILGSQLGKRDDQSRTRWPLGYVYGLTSNAISGVLGAIFLSVSGKIPVEFGAAIVVATAAVSLTTIYLANKNTVKGQRTKDVFQ